MWQAGTYLLILGSLFLVLRQSRRLRHDWPSMFVILIVWTRFAMAALGEAAINTTVAGFSLIALATLGMTGIGFLLVPLDYFRTQKVLPFYALSGVGMLGAALAGGGVALVSYVIIWAFFIVCALLLYRAYLIHGHQLVLACLLAAFSLPFGMQGLSLVLDSPKVGMDGSLSYVGGYVHEAVFAVVALGALWVVTVYRWSQPRVGWVAIAVVLAGLYLANYRTIIIAAAPIMLAFLVAYSGSDRRRDRRLGVALVLAVLVLPQTFSWLAGDRYEEIGIVATEIGHLVKPPEEFTASEKNVLSARLYIWSTYIYGALNADIPQLLLGHGPESRPPGMTVHAHNEYLRILFETGIIGLFIWISVFGRQMSLAIRSASQPVGLVTAAGFAAVLLGALGTSFFNRPEGMILLAMLCSTNWHLADQRRLAQRTSGSYPTASPALNG